MSRRFFAAGAWVLILMGLVHLAGHVAMQGATGENEAERQLLKLMHESKTDFGLGFVRSMGDLMSGFSLTFSILPIGIGLMDLLVQRRGSAVPGLMRSLAIVNAATFGVMSVVGFVYWFIAPISFLVLAFLCFGAATVTTPRAGQVR